MAKEISKDNIASNNHATMQGWMRTELDLKGNELIAYTIIWSFTQEKGYYDGGQGYIASWCGISSKNGICNVLNSLEKKGFIEKTEKSSQGFVKRYIYRAIRPTVQKNYTEEDNSTKNLDCNSTKNLDCYSTKNLDCTVQKIWTNKYNNKYNNNIYNYNCPEAPHNEQLNGQIEFDTTESFDSYCSNNLNITIKKKIIEMTNLSGIAVKQIVDTANKVNMSDSKLIEVIKYCMSKECKDLAGYIIKTIPNYVEPKQNSSKSGFNNFNGRSYTEKDYEAIEKALLSH